MAARRAVSVLVIAVSMLGGQLLATEPTPAVAAGGTPILAADYFGIANPLNFWSSDISGASSAFRTMKADGFSTVALVLPWGEFETGIRPIRFNSDAFSRLDTLIRTAAHVHMGVILRLGYEFDIDPADQMPTVNRVEAAYAGGPAYRAWLAYISKVHENVAGFSNVRMAYISWEDLSYPIQVAQELSGPLAVQLAGTIGFQTWLKGNHSLPSINSLYGTHFTSWSQVPTPPSASPAFRLMYEYQDWALVHHFFDAAQRRFPGLTMETRVDVDPLYSGSQVVGSYAHDSEYRLPGTSVTGIYFSPYMGDPSSAQEETAPEALTALETTLHRMASLSGGRPLFIYEYEIASNSPAVNNDPSLTPSQVGPFVEQSGPVLRKYTKGYALWTYRDFNMSGVYNPSFSLGFAGWAHSGVATTVEPKRGRSFVLLGSGGAVSQTVSPGNIVLPPGAPVTLSLDASSSTASGSSLHVTVGEADSQSISLQRGWNSYSFQIPQSALGNGKVVIQSSGPSAVSDVQLYAFTQQGDVYSNTGGAEVAVGPLTTLNHQLLSKQDPSS